MFYWRKIRFIVIFPLFIFGSESFRLIQFFLLDLYLAWLHFFIFFQTYLSKLRVYYWCVTFYLNVQKNLQGNLITLCNYLSFGYYFVIRGKCHIILTCCVYLVIFKNLLRFWSSWPLTLLYIILKLHKLHQIPCHFNFFNKLFLYPHCFVEIELRLHYSLLDTFKFSTFMDLEVCVLHYFLILAN